MAQMRQRSIIGEAPPAAWRSLISRLPRSHRRTDHAVSQEIGQRRCLSLRRRNASPQAAAALGAARMATSGPRRSALRAVRHVSTGIVAVTTELRSRQSPTGAIGRLTVLMPCLNEAETVGVCVTKARAYLNRMGVRGEVLVADNGSTDGSQRLARRPGRASSTWHREATAPRSPAASPPPAGATSSWATPTTATTSAGSTPSSSGCGPGDQLVMGNRFAGGIAAGAMPPLHRYLGNPVLSFIGRLLFRSRIGDFHCGLRGFDARRDPRARAELAGHGVRERDGRQGDARRPAHRRGADDAVARRPLAARRTCEAGATAGGTCASC